MLRERLTREHRRVDEGPPRALRKRREEQISNDHGFPVFTVWSPEATGSAADDVWRPRPRRSVFYLHGGAYVRRTDDRH